MRHGIKAGWNGAITSDSSIEFMERYLRMHILDIMHVAPAQWKCLYLPILRICTEGQGVISESSW